ncbi:MAG: hypothetical protein HFJ44_03255 [Clostridia bacterium]|nr:hypothetical protein [Clostridia bacterium]
MRNDVVMLRTKKSTYSMMLIYIIGILVLSSILSIVYSSISILIFEILGLALVLLFQKQDDVVVTRAIILIKCISYIFIFLVFYGNIQEYGAPYYHGGSDDLDFEIYTMEFIKNNYIWPWEYKGIHNAKGMLSLFASLIRISNIFETYHTLAFRLLNMDILICISIILYKICRRDLRMSKKVSLICMLTMGLLPNSLFLTSFVFRDTICCFLIITFFSFSLDFIKKEDSETIFTKKRFVALFMMLFISFCGYWIRKELFYLNILIFIVSLIGNRKIGVKEVLISFCIVIMLLFVFYRIGILDFFLNKMERYRIYHTKLINENGSNYLYRMIFLTPLLPFGIIYRILFGLVSPLPTGILKILSFNSGLSVCDFLIALGSLFQIIMLPFLVISFKKIDKYHILFLLIFLPIVISTFTFRHFILLYPFLFILVYRSFFSVSRGYKQLYVMIGICGLFLMGVMYMMFILL